MVICKHHGHPASKDRALCELVGSIAFEEIERMAITRRGPMSASTLAIETLQAALGLSRS